MKKADLIIPKWPERRPLLLPGLLYVPEYYDFHQEFDLSAQFAQERKTAIEYCSGNGSWIAKKAKNNPDVNWIAVEKRFDRAKKIWKHISRDQLDNLHVVLGDAETYTKFYVKSKFDEVYINFPDPWPKKKHEKHRLIKLEFFQNVFSVLKENGSFFLATDDENTCLAAIDLLLQTGFMPMFKEPYFINEWPDYGESFFLNLWQKKGLSIKYIHFKKNS